jgi:hypothetical protein
MRTYPDNSRVFLENRCGRFDAKVMLAEETRCYDLKGVVRYCCLSCTRRAPELCHLTALKATSKGIVEHSDICVCIAWWVIVVGKIAERFRC